MNAILKQYLVDRAKEPSTWRGLAMLATGAGVYVAPEILDQVIVVGTGVAGLIGMFTREVGR